MLEAIWKEILGRDVIGIHRNFFDMGGDSLMLARIQLLLKHRCNLTISLVTLFRYPTIHLLSQFISEQHQDHHGNSESPKAAVSDLISDSYHRGSLRRNLLKSRRNQETLMS